MTEQPSGPIVVVGEVLCDLFAQRPGEALARTRALAPQLGGAPANAAVQLARLGTPVRLVSAVGRDPLGERLRAQLAREGVDVSAVRVDPQRRTGLTLVEVDRRGERSFYGWRENAADLCIAARDVVAPLRGAWGVLHGTVSLRAPGSRAAVDKAVALATRSGGVACLDVNLRFGMYKSRTQLLSLARSALRRVHVVKASDDEAVALFGTRGVNDAVDALLSRGPSLVFLTRGARGAVVATPRARVSVPAPRVRALDATGAGDAFLGAALAALRTLVRFPAQLLQLDAHTLRHIGAFACEVGARSVTAVGATAAMPRGRPFQLRAAAAVRPGRPPR